MRAPKSSRGQKTPPVADPLVIRGDRVSGAAVDRLGVELSVKFGEDSHGRLCVTSVTVTHSEGVTANLLGRLPLAQIEKQQGQQVARFVEQMDRTMKDVNERNALVQLNKMLAKVPGPARAGDLPDRFYQVVAAAYLLHVTSVTPAVRTPSRVIAIATGTPDSTVRGWVRKARLRGYLPPARRGAAG
jgi:hypothetical protein